MSARLPETAPLERCVDRRELAATMGVSERTISRFVAEGMPSETWGMKRTRRYRPSACVAWARARGSSSSVSADTDAVAAVVGEPRSKE